MPTQAQSQPLPPALPREGAELLVLSILAEGSTYGYRIIKLVAARSEGLFSLAPAKLYPLLTRLEKQGLVSASWDEIKAEGANPEALGRRRKWYSLSDKGSKRLAARIADHRRFTNLMDAFIHPAEAAQHPSSRPSSTRLA